MGHTVVNGSVHTGCKQHQRVCIQICMQICLRVLCEQGLNMLNLVARQKEKTWRYKPRQWNTGSHCWAFFFFVFFFFLIFFCQKFHGERRSWSSEEETQGLHCLRLQDIVFIGLKKTAIGVVMFKHQPFVPLVCHRQREDHTFCSNSIPW